MKRSEGTVAAISALGYPGDTCLSRCHCDELPCPLLTWVTSQLKTLCPELQESGGSGGGVLLVGELRRLLSELDSPLSGQTSELLEPGVLLRVTEFLVSELQAALIVKHKEPRPEEGAGQGQGQGQGQEAPREQRAEASAPELTEVAPRPTDADVCESSGAAEMQAEWVLLLHALNMDAASTFTDVLQQVESRLGDGASDEASRPLLRSSLSSEQWAQLAKLNQVLSDDYRCRRQMMVTRFQVTLESFAWGDKQKERREALSSVPSLASMSSSSRVSLSLLLAAREDRSCIEPIRPGKSTDVYKRLMGHVPDRGGRPGEIEPPMPSWQDQRAKGNRSGRGRGQGRGHGRQGHKSSDKKKKGKKE